MFHIYLTGLDPVWVEGLPIACAAGKDLVLVAKTLTS